MNNSAVSNHPITNQNAQKNAPYAESITLQLDTAKMDVACYLGGKPVLNLLITVAHDHNSRTVVAQRVHINPMSPADTADFLRDEKKSLALQGKKLDAVLTDSALTFQNAEFVAECHKLGIRIVRIPGTSGFVTERYFHELNAFLQSSAGIRKTQSGEMGEVLDAFAKDIYGGTRKR